MRYVPHAVFVALLFLVTLSSPHARADAPAFENYPSLPMYWGERHTAVLSQKMCRGLRANDWCPWESRARLELANEKEVNFDGAFTLTSWKQGMVKWVGAIIDRSDGAVYTLPPALYGYKYRLNSSLLIVNPKHDELRTFYTFERGQFKLVWRDGGQNGQSLLDTSPADDAPLLDVIEKEVNAAWCKKYPVTCIE